MRRAFEDEKKARMGVVECAKHDLLQPFTVLYEKEGEEALSLSAPVPSTVSSSPIEPSCITLPPREFVAQFKFTVLLMANGPMRITNGPLEPEFYKSEHEVQDADLKLKQHVIDGEKTIIQNPSDQQRHLHVRVLKAVVEAAKVGELVVVLCEKGDAMIMEETGKIFKKEKEMKKGIAFPTSVSVNNCVCHFSPLKSDPDYALKEGDLVKM
ncbi:Proliferation-associated protein 2G4 [Acipenser ruthenus]|uniref:Proliferation-associated protein 2G4 n=1 Tax=Acipenser ruthenus TaxID=7906 RepID=A0A444UTG6_ACIRT|nr:Proliferation-associated protein 2G4 [Acipenser ruthenus]